MLQRKGGYPAPPGLAARHPRARAGRRGGGARTRARAASRRATASWPSSAVAGRRSWRSCTSAPRCRCRSALDWPAAGGLPEVFTTAHDALFTQAGLRPGRAPARARRGRAAWAPPRCQLGRAAGARVTATVRREELRPQVEAARRPRDRSRGLRGRGPVRRRARAGRRLEPRREPERARDRRADRRDRRGRHGPEGRDQPPHAHAQARPHPRLHAARAAARGEGGGDAAGREGGAAALRERDPDASPLPRPSSSTGRGMPTSASTAGGKLGKIVLLP